METVTLGKTGIEVSKNGFGALPIQRIEKKDAVYLLQKAFYHGINYFDTAYPYHGGEFEDFFKDLCVYVAAALVAFVFFEWLLHIKEGIVKRIACRFDIPLDRQIAVIQPRINLNEVIKH